MKLSLRGIGIPSRKSGLCRGGSFRGCLPVLAFLASVLVFSHAYGQGREKSLYHMSLEELMNVEVMVYGASKYFQRENEAPSSISIVTADEIKKFGYRTLSDILRSVRGFYVTYDRNYHYFGARGFGRTGDFNSKILILINGHRVNETVYPMGFIGTDLLLDLDLIDRVEVIRGPSSSLYGTSAFFGVINIITKKAEVYSGPEVSASGGSLRTFSGRATYGNIFGEDWSLLASASAYWSRGEDRLYYREYDSADSNYGVTENSDYDRFRNMFASVSYSHFTLEAAFGHRKKGIPTGSWGTFFNDRGNYNAEERGYVSLTWRREFSDSFHLKTKVSYDHYRYFGDYIYEYSEGGGPPQRIVNKDFTNGRWVSTEIQGMKRFGERHTLIAGAEYQWNLQQDMRNYDEAPYFPYMNVEKDSENWAVYLQHEFRVSKRFLTNIGIRHDYYDSFGGTTSPRLGVIYQPLDDTYLKFIYGEAFRAPSVYEADYDALAAGYKTNPNLKPETIRTYELILERKLGDHMRLSLSGFYYKIDDLVAVVKDPADDLLIFKNMNSVSARGVEAELSGKWPNGWEARLSYSYTKAENSQGEGELVNSPRHLAKAHVVAPLFRDKVFAGTELQYVSSRKTLFGNEVDEYLVANVTIFSRKIVKGLELSASAYNLFDKRFADPAGEEHLQERIEQDGRLFRIKATYRF